MTKVINLARGKPNKDQLDLSNDILNVLNSDDLINNDIDYRNYGLLSGIEECKSLFGDILGVSKDNVIIYGNSSLNIMYDLISKCYSHGVCGSTPWCKLPKAKWLCPVPGYDRHFAITEYFNIEMINIPMNSDGPDMDLIEEYIKDESVKGIWCVPKYSNPSGVTYSDEVVRRFARLKPKAKDFRIYWDNAYIIHDLYDESKDELLNIFTEAEKENNSDLVYIFTSTSKITFPGAGVAALAASSTNILDILNQMKYQTISHDKINQLRHVKYFKDINGVKLHMKKHADILRPKFELVESIFEKELKDLAIWTKPLGGYFISLNVKGIAKEVVELCKSRGVILTDAGATYPYHNDPTNSNIRIAPSYLDIEELKEAIEVVCNVIKELSK